MIGALVVEDSLCSAKLVRQQRKVPLTFVEVIACKASRGQHHRRYTSKFVYIHQDSYIYIKIRIYTSRFVYIHQDSYIYRKIRIYTARFVYIQQDSYIYRKIRIYTARSSRRACNCKKKEECPLEGNCLAKGIVYQAQVTAAGKTETYVGLTSTEFKARFRNHQMSFNNDTRNNDTELSKHIWQLKSKEQRFTIKRKILAKAPETLLQPDKAMQSMHSGEALHLHQTGNGNIKLTKRTDFYMPAPTKVHPQIWLTVIVFPFLQSAHTSTQ